MPTANTLVTWTWHYLTEILLLWACLAFMALSLSGILRILRVPYRRWASLVSLVIWAGVGLIGIDAFFPDLADIPPWWSLGRYIVDVVGAFWVTAFAEFVWPGPARRPWLMNLGMEDAA